MIGLHDSNSMVKQISTIIFHQTSCSNAVGNHLVTIIICAQNWNHKVSPPHGCSYVKKVFRVHKIIKSMCRKLVVIAYLAAWGPMSELTATPREGEGGTNPQP